MYNKTPLGHTDEEEGGERIFGKSLCYTCLSVMFNLLEPEKHSIVIVVSPFTPIIEDQVSEHH